jgi:hypothetical protein
MISTNLILCLLLAVAIKAGRYLQREIMKIYVFLQHLFKFSSF